MMVTSVTAQPQIRQYHSRLLFIILSFPCDDVTHSGGRDLISLSQ